MFRNYITIAFRHLFKNRTYSVINVAGLAVGMAVALIIGLWIYDEMSFNKYHSTYDRLGRVMHHTDFNGEIITGWSEPVPLGLELRSKYTGFKEVAMASWNYGHVIQYADKKINREGVYAEPQLLRMLGLRMISGGTNPLADINSIVISASLAKAIFGDEDPLNKIITADNQNTLKVTAVFEDPPHNSDFSNIHMYFTWDLYVKDNPWVRSSAENWGNYSFQTFVLLNEGVDFTAQNEKMKNLLIEKNPDNTAKSIAFIHPMSKWHLYAEFKNGINTGGGIQFVWLFGIIAVFVLLLACINFMNLSTARSEKRAKEVGIRKAVGSERKQLILQFMVESSCLVGIAFLLSLLLTQLSLPWFNELSDKRMSIIWNNPVFWSFAIGFVLLTSFISGSYPAFFLSAFNPVTVLKGLIRSAKNSSLPRKILVTVQFTVSIALIIGVMVVYYQIQYAKNRPVGYNRSGLITTWLGGLDKGKAELFKEELMRTGAIESVGASSSPTTALWSFQSDFDWEGKPADMQPNMGVVTCTFGYGQTVGYRIKEGRDFSKQFATDSAAIIINEAAVSYMGMKDPVGKIVRYNLEPFTIVGVINNMVMESPYEPIRPMVYFVSYTRVSDFYTIRLKRNLPMNESISRIGPVYKKFSQDNPFEYTFVDEVYDRKFQSEARIGKLASVFAGLAIFISCLGLFGLAAFVAERRTKEIGIRKVLGASILDLWVMLSKEFTILVIVSCFISIPIAWYFMDKWLQDFTYRVTVSWWLFAIAGLSALLIALLTVSFQAIKAAIANPVRSLRSE